MAIPILLWGKLGTEMKAGKLVEMYCLEMKTCKLVRRVLEDADFVKAGRSVCVGVRAVGAVKLPMTPSLLEKATCKRQRS